MSVTDEEIRTELEEEDGDRDDDLVAYLQTRAGTALRCVVEYDERGWDVAYNRENLDREELETVIEEMRMRVRAAARGSETATGAEPRIAVSCYEAQAIVHIPRADRRNLAILLRASATPQIRSFAEACRARLDD